MKQKIVFQKSGKIHNIHLDRIAIIYIRQSTIQQVQRHVESTKLQYALANKAESFGWAKQLITIIDDDLGCSGSNTEGRPGFQRLVSEVSMNKVGIILGIEMSRLARSCRDWHQLLEVCALFNTLIGDADGVYDPTNYNDRLLLGLKGTMSEAELHIIKQRMVEGKRAKAKRGELGMQLPRGYIKRTSGEIVKDPDEQVQNIIQLIFDLFRKFSTLNKVLKYLVVNKIHLPDRIRSGINKGDLSWNRPNRATLTNMLHNPIYAGAYVYGRRPTDNKKKKPGRPATGRVTVHMGEWEVCIKDHLPAYISWEQYENNRQQLIKNTNKVMGFSRGGASLLTGLLICGHCGLRMSPSYNSVSKTRRYSCSRMATDYGEPLCQSLQGECLDNVVINWVLKALEPASLEISLQVACDIETEQKKLNKNWQQRLERGNYEVQRSYRQYNSVDPENRLVARNLEKNYENALLEEEKLKQQYDKFLLQKPNSLSTEERDAIRKLSSNIKLIWNSSVTTDQDRQQILRQVLDRIVITVLDQTEKTSVQLHWAGGHITSDYFNRPVAKLEQLSYYKELLARIRNLHIDGHKASEIALIINSEGWKPPKRREDFNSSRDIIEFCV